VDLGLLVSPVWVLVVLIGSLYALISIVVFGPGASRPISIISAGCLGAIVGQIISDMFRFHWLRVGDLHIFQTAVGAITIVMIGRYLAVRKAVRIKGAH
jgi:uncharacterized membrane protein YeaQ/YmgE (transglycosylase-associated protein family)